MAVGRVVQTRLRLIDDREASLAAVDDLPRVWSGGTPRDVEGQLSSRRGEGVIALEWTSVMCIHLFHGLGLANVAHYVAAGHRRAATSHPTTAKPTAGRLLAPRRGRQPHHLSMALVACSAAACGHEPRTRGGA